MTKDNTAEYFAVIDVETNWDNHVMSIGVVVADKATFAAIDKRYYIIHPECEIGGIYSAALRDINPALTTDCDRAKAMADLSNVFAKYNVKSIFAYNACFDRSHMIELSDYAWYDIMRVAPYRQYNSKIPADTCGPSGRLKRGYGVEGVMRILMGWDGYRESHNALCDAVDELQIMQLLNQPLDVYPEYLPKQTAQHKKLSVKSSAYTHSGRLLSVDDCRYFVDEFYGGSVKLVNAIRNTNTYLFDLMCCRCGHKWQQDIEGFIQHPKCPNCLGMGK